MSDFQEWECATTLCQGLFFCLRFVTWYKSQCLLHVLCLVLAAGFCAESAAGSLVLHPQPADWLLRHNHPYLLPSQGVVWVGWRVSRSVSERSERGHLGSPPYSKQVICSVDTCALALISFTANRHKRTIAGTWCMGLSHWPMGFSGLWTSEVEWHVNFRGL